MTSIEDEPLLISFNSYVAKMRDRDATDLEIQAMLEFVEQSIRWREEKKSGAFGQRLEGGSGPFPLDRSGTPDPIEGLNGSWVYQGPPLRNTLGAAHGSVGKMHFGKGRKSWRAETRSSSQP